MDDLPSPLNLTDDELLEVRKFALKRATDVAPWSGETSPKEAVTVVTAAAIAFERFLVFGDAGESK